MHVALKGGTKKKTGMYFLGQRTGRFLSKRALLETKEQIARWTNTGRFLDEGNFEIREPQALTLKTLNPKSFSKDSEAEAGFW